MHAYIKNLIDANQGSISIVDFVNAALYHEKYGYYMKKIPFGIDGDFTTAPEISQLFGETIAVWLMYYWQQIGEPSEFILVELGPGRGTLMSDILRITKKFKKFYDAITIHLVEISPILSELQKKTLFVKSTPKRQELEAAEIGKIKLKAITQSSIALGFKKKFNIFWHKNINTLPDKPMLLIANEFFDALPIQQFIYTDSRWYENHIAINCNKFQVIKKPTTKLFEIRGIKTNSVVEICSAAKEVLQSIEDRVINNGGAALIIDYGYTEPPYINTIQAIKQHNYHDFLVDVGECDITAHVDFSTLIKNLLYLHSTILTQREFLYSFGIRERLQALMKVATEKQQQNLRTSFLRLTENMGALFKVLIISSINKIREIM